MRFCADELAAIKTKSRKQTDLKLYIIENIVQMKILLFMQRKGALTNCQDFNKNPDFKTANASFMPIKFILFFV